MTIAPRRSARFIRALAAFLALSMAVFGLTIVSEIVVAPTSAVAAEGAGLPFECLTPTFFSLTSDGTQTQLYKGTFSSAGLAQFTAFGPNQTGANVYNAMGFNPIDNFLYATTAAGSIVKVDSTGNVVATFAASPALGAAPNTLWDSGTFDTAGNYYVANGYNGAPNSLTIYKITGLATASAATPPQLKPLTFPAGTAISYADLTFKDGFLWAHSYGGSIFYRIGLPSTGTALTVTPVTSTAIPSASYGSAFTLNNGNLGFIKIADGTPATAGFYQVAVSNATGTLTAASFSQVNTVVAPSNSRSDATNCKAQPANLGVVKTGPAAVLVNAAVSWTITVHNYGPGPSSGFSVKDTLPAGIIGATATSAAATCSAASGGVITCSGGALANGGNVVITVSGTAPNAAAVLTNTALVAGYELDPVSSNDSSTVTTNVAPTPLTAANDTATTGYPATVTTQATAVNIPVLANDVGTGMTVTAVTAPSNGTAVITGSTVGNTVTYTPAAGFSGSDSFSYTVTDQYDQVKTATVTVTVTPRAYNDTAATSTNTPVSFNVLANDAGSTETATKLTNPANGTVAFATNGAVTYTPNAGFSGTDTFTYTQTAASGTGTATSGATTVTITVTPLAVADSYTTPVNVSVPVSVLDNDKGTSITATKLTDPAHGTVTIAANGTGTYVPNAEFTGTDSFTYTLSGTGGSATATATITVTPTAANDSATTTSTVAVAGNVLTNDHGTNRSIAVTTAPTHGTVVLDPTTGAYTYTPTGTFSGADSFVYTLTADGGTATATVSIAVTPTAVNDTITTGVNVAASGNIATNDNGSNKSVVVGTTVTHGTLVLSGSGAYTYTPNTNFTGTDSFTYTLTADGGTSTATATITVTPLAVDDDYTTPAGTPAALSVLANDKGTNKTAAKLTNPANGTVVLAADGTGSYTPNAGFSGTDSFTYTLTGDGGTAVGTVTITVTPVAVADTLSTPVSTAAAGNLLTNDLGTGKSAAVTSGPAHGTFALTPATGAYTYTPTGGYSGPDSVSYTLTAAGGTSSSILTISVTPKAVDDSGTTNANTAITIPGATLVANDGGTGLTVTSVSAAVNGTIAYNGGNPTFTPTIGFSGTGSYQYNATDSAGTTSAAIVTITVLPTATADTATTNANTPVTSSTLTANDSGTGLTVTAVGTAVNGTVTLNAGSPIFTPTTGFSGVGSYSYTATDAAGKTTSATVTVTVLPVAAADARTTNANTAITLSNLTANDAGTGLAVTTVGTAVNGTVVVNGGSPIFTPTNNFSGTASFIYTATDAAGKTTSATVTVTVLPIAAADTATTNANTPVTSSTLTANDAGTGLTVTAVGTPVNGAVAVNGGSPIFTPTTGFSGLGSYPYTATDAAGKTTSATVTVTVLPVAAGDSATTNANSPVTSSTLTANDAGTGLTVTAVSTPVNGTVVLNAGSPIFTPASNFSGTASYVYTATDGNSKTSSATVTITVLPVAVADAKSTNANTLVTLSALTANDAGTGLTVTAVSTPVNGTIALNGGSPIFTPANNFSGTGSFVYTAADTAGKTTSATVTITVLPVATADAGTTNANTPVTFATLTGNDAGSGLTVTAVGTPVNGTVALNAGSPIFTPANNFSGQASYGYTATDSAGKTTTATVTVTVLPTASADAAATGVNVPVTILGMTLVGNDAGTGLTVTAVGSAVNGTVALNGGNPIFTPALGFSGTGSFAYTATDTAGKTTTATVTVTITPGAVNDAASTVVDLTLTIPAATLLANDSGSGLTITAVASPVNGTVSLNASGNPVFVPTANFSGIASFQYAATDSASHTTTATVTVTVVPKAVADTATTSANTAVTTSASALLANDRGTGLTVTAVSNGTNGTVSLVSGNPVFAPTNNFSGVATFDYTVTDGIGSTSTTTVTVAVLPVAAGDTATTNANSPVTSATLTANDAGTGLTVTAVGTAVNGAVVLNSGSPIFTPANNFSGAASYGYTATDGNSKPTSATVTITVLPIAAGDSATTNANTSLTNSTLTANDAGTGLTVTAVGAPVNGTVTLNAGSPIFTPSTNFSGTASYVYTATDGNAKSSSATVTITVLPIAAADAKTTNANVPVTLSTLTANDAGTGLTVTAISTPVNGTVVLNGGSPIFTPTSNFSGTGSFMYSASDLAGKTTTATVTITVLPVAVADAKTTNANTPVTLSTLTANDAGTGLTVTAVGTPVNGTVALNAGSPIFTPANNFSGAASFVYTATDATGTAASATVLVTVLPTASGDSARTGVNAPLTIPAATLVANDAGTVLTVTAVGSATNGTVALNGGNPRFTPAAGFSGTATFGYTATDAAGASTSATVTITVAPGAANDSASTTVDVTLTIPAVDLLSNDSGTGLTVTAVSTPVNGTVSLTGGNAVFVPTANFSGAASFQYTDTDSLGTSTVATVAVTVLPKAVADSATTTANTAVASAASALLANDRGTGLSVSAVSNAIHGSVALNGGSPVFTPAAGFSGQASYGYTVTDAAGSTSTATVTVTVLPTAVADTTSTPANTPVTTPGTDLTANDLGTGVGVVAVANGTNGTVALNGGNPRFTPTAGFSGSATYLYTATDAAGKTATATVTVIVRPVSADDSASTDANVALDIPGVDLVGNDIGVGLVVTAVSAATHGTVTLASGVATFVPASGFSGPATFGYTATDSSGSTSTATVTVTVLPIAAADSATTNVNTPVTSSALTANDAGSGLTVTAVGSANNGSVSRNGGAPIFTPSSDFSGQASYAYTATDAAGNSTTATVTITVLPVAVPDSATTNANTPVTLSALTANDAGSGLTVTAVASATNGTVALGGGTPIFTPTAGYSGPASFAYTATDSSGAATSSTVAITVRPVAAADAATTSANSAVTVSGAALLSNDSGTGLAITAVGSASHGAITLNAGNPTFTPASGFSGVASFAYTATDAAGTTTTATVTVTVTPTAAADAATTTANTDVTIAGTALTGNDAGSGLTVTAVANPTNGTVVLGGGSPVFTPVVGYSGTASFEYTATDAAGTTATAIVTVTVTPTASADSANTTANTTVVIPVATLTGNDAGSGLAVTAVSGATHGTVSLSGGTAAFTPANNYSGPAAFTYTVTDGSGRTATATVSLTVTPTSLGDSAATGVDVPLVIPGATLTANDAGTGLTVTGVSTPVNGTVLLNPSVSGAGNPRFTPAAGFSGVASFQYTATDASGASTTAMVTVMVSPGAVDDNGSTPAATPVTFPAARLLANDSGAGLTITAVSAPVNGTVTVNGGDPRFTPAVGFSGAASFDYTVTDGAGTVTTATVHVTVTPTAAADVATTNAGAPVTVGAAALLGNDTGSALQLTNVSNPTHGAVALLAGSPVSAEFTPAAGFSGLATFDYTATDAAGQQVTATVTVSVLPTATPDQASTNAGTAVTIFGLTANDSGTLLSVTGVSAAVGGSVTLNGGSPRFTPAAGFSGAASFVYTATDASGNSVASTVSVTVLPVATPDVASTRGGAPLTVSSAALIGDDLGSGLALTGVGSPVNGTVVRDVAGNPVFTPTPGYSGQASFDYTVTDASGHSSTATVTITVLPLAVVDSATTDANTAVTIPGSTLIANDSGSILTVTAVGIPTHGTVALGGGNPVFTPAAGFSGAASFGYTATDSAGNTTRAIVTVTVHPVAAPDSTSTLAGTPVTISGAILVGNDAGSTLSVTAVATAVGGTVVLGAGSALFTPAAGFSGQASFGYTVTDSSGQTAASTVTVTVLPTAVGDSLTLTAGTPATVSGAVLAGNDAGTGLTVTAVASATHGTVDLLNGIVTFTPAAGFSGNASFSYRATDASGQRVTATVAVTVLPNATPDTRTTSAGIDVVTAASALTANDLGSSLVISAVANAVGGTVSLQSGTVRFVPAAGFSGAASYDYTVTDAAGNAATATVAITVGPVAVGDVDATVTGIAVDVPVLANDLGTNLIVTSASPSSHGTVTIVAGGIRYLANAGYSGADVFTYVMTGDGGSSTATVRIAVSPTSAGDVGTTVADQGVDIDVLANDTGTGFVITDPGAPTHGTTRIVGARIRYIPAARFSGTDSFSYTARDEAGVLRTALVTVFVSPVSVPDTATGTANSPVVIDLDGNDIGSNLRVTEIGTPSIGTASIQRNGTVSFVPPAGWSGIVTMVYTTTDWAGLTTTNLATITIRPTAAPDAAKTPANTAVTFPVLGNDVGAGLTVSAFTKSAHGTMAIAADGTATFTPDADWFGLETLSYTTTDAEGSTATSTITITVAAAPSIGLAFTGTMKTGLAYTGLAFTGVDPWSMIATGILLLLLGVMIVIVGRRNRTDP